MEQIRRLDVFPKFDSKFELDARDKTVSGAILSVLALVLMTVLAFAEVRYYMRLVVRKELFVDPDVGGMLNIEVNVSFPHVPCDLITVDSVDFFGTYAEGMSSKAAKHRIDKHLNPIADSVREKSTAATHSNECGSCLGAAKFPGDCCNTCDDVKSHYESRGWRLDVRDPHIPQCEEERLNLLNHVEHHEGCNVFSHMTVGRVKGNLHFIPGRMSTSGGRHMHDISDSLVQRLNLSHVVHELRFGDYLLHNPLNGHSLAIQSGTGSGKFQYFVNVVPTRYEGRAIESPERSTGPFSFLGSRAIETYQYSCTEHVVPNKDSNGGSGLGSSTSFLPGVFMMYDFAPIKVRVFTESPYNSFVHLLLQLCAICGGVFAVAGLIDALLYHGASQIKRKMQLGKLA